MNLVKWKFFGFGGIFLILSSTIALQLQASCEKIVKSLFLKSSEVSNLPSITWHFVIQMQLDPDQKRVSSLAEIISDTVTESKLKRKSAFSFAMAEIPDDYPLDLPYWWMKILGPDQSSLQLIAAPELGKDEIILAVQLLSGSSDKVTKKLGFV